MSVVENPVRLWSRSVHIHLMLNRLTYGGRPVFHYRKEAAQTRRSGAKKFPDSL
jgi:hypothetical protein